MAQPGPESIWPWIGTAGTAPGTPSLVGRGWSVAEPERELFHVVTTVVAAVAPVGVEVLAKVTGPVGAPAVAAVDRSATVGLGWLLLRSRAVLEQATRPAGEAVPA